MSEHGSPDARRLALSDLSGGYKRASILLTANHLGLFRALAPAPLTADELAAHMETDRRATTLLLDALAAMDLLSRSQEGRYSLRGLAEEFLHPEAEHYQGDILNHGFYQMRRWAKLAEVVRSGDPAPKEGGKRDRTRDELRAFILGMQNIAQRSAEETADALDLRGIASILDCGGGPGTYLHAFLRRLPEARGAVLDFPDVVDIAREQAEKEKMTGRVDYLPGSMFERDLEGPWDLVFLGNIIHSWGEEDVRTILRRSAEALASGGRLAVKDFFLDERGLAPEEGVIFSINMLVGTPEGRSYRRADVEAWMDEAGLDVVQYATIGSHSGLLVGMKR